MNSDLPKVMHPANGKPMVRSVVESAKAAGVDHITLIVGHGADLVRHEFAGDASITFAAAAASARHRPRRRPGPQGLRASADGEDVFVLCGDGPLIRPATLTKLLATHRADGASATLATSVISDPQGYGRIERDAGKRFKRIVEQKDATPEQLKIREVNPSYYCFKVGDLFAALSRVDNKNKSGEYYITDVFELLLREGKRVSVVDAVPPEDVLSVNTPDQLAEVDRILKSRPQAKVSAA
jgi:bifunctional N-acetylglucosamine-1-phosphate-uridyltransferase/glucosamine-1-phosphate-acetyltransferase GlmU-like protein